jgi:hypothetical protein
MVAIVLTDACRRAGHELVVAFNRGNHLVAQRLVAAGTGVALILDMSTTVTVLRVVLRAIAAIAPYRRICSVTVAKADESIDHSFSALAALRKAPEVFVHHEERPAGSCYAYT